MNIKEIIAKLEDMEDRLNEMPKEERMRIILELVCELQEELIEP